MNRIDHHGGALNILTPARPDNAPADVNPHPVALHAARAEGNDHFEDGNRTAADGNGVSVAIPARVAETPAGTADGDVRAADVPQPNVVLPQAFAEIDGSTVEADWGSAVSTDSTTIQCGRETICVPVPLSRSQSERSKFQAASWNFDRSVWD